MPATQLYVIGNGFDLWHDIPSRLSDFKDYVRVHDLALIREVEEYLPTQDNWSDLEVALAGLDVDELVDNLGHFMAPYSAEDWSDAGHHDFQYEVDNVVQRLSVGLRQRFGAWIRQLSIPTPAAAPRRLHSLDRNAAFLSFNYTSTLQTVYGVPPERTLFIHGCAELADDELVLGHAWSPDTRKSLNDRPGIEEIDTRLMEAHEIIDEYFSATFKPSAHLIKSNRSFFESLNHVREVTVLGHSLSEVDAAYFHALFEQPALAATHWHVACRSMADWSGYRQRLAQMGLPPAQVQLAQPMLWDAL
ncbi:hypothetical protein DTW89_10780 [Acidovorax sp. BoFeN1]|uniref:bacteriophage abortive infection AbiH family protein n=1 Tax=Acidovorax sp. BoFeN1 TaxID=1231053 RepID=UPI000E08DDC7|nr:bacteriophage abortive infection AbiH family protein [Acidovorax sp. BoFeN1]RDD92964.1 hypothetical protein DTW89_10780 [Acidovorax sp. BoFeN1]